ncbi:MAG: phosphate ABC transporter ATP-binding protein [Candidatus Hodarchaeota archaeon]
MDNANTDCLLCLENVTYVIGSKKILDDISVKIESKGITGIIGPSGSGKSTFLRLLNKLITPTRGTLLFQGKNYNSFPPRVLRKQIGLVQQRPYLFSGSVMNNLEYGPKIWGINYSENDYVELLRDVALSKDFLDRDVESLSGGEQQRVSLARSKSNQPSILLLDEPTSSLDVVSSEIIEETIKNLSQQGIKIIIVTHSLSQTKNLTDQLLFLKAGRLIEKTDTESFFRKNSEEEIKTFFKKKEVLDV